MAIFEIERNLIMSRSHEMEPIVFYWNPPNLKLDPHLIQVFSEFITWGFTKKL